MPFIFPLLFAGALGALFILNITRDANLRFYPFFVLALSFPVGLSICSLLIFGSYFLKANQGPFFSTLAALALMAFFIMKLTLSPSFNITNNSGLKKSWYESLSLSWRAASKAQKNLWIIFLSLWLFIFLKFTTLLQSVSINNVFGGWDARFFWNVKASFFFRAPEEWKNMFSASLSWTHPDYPLLLPGAVAWGWNWAGSEMQIWPSVVAFVFLFSTLFLIAWYLGATIHPLSGLLGSSFFMTVGAFSFWGVSQYADVPLLFFFTASGLLLLEAFRSKNTGLFFLAGWLTGCSAWTKNEGLFFVGWTGFTAGLFFLKNIKKIPSWRSCLINLSLGILLPLLAVLVLKTTLAESGDYLGSGRGAGTYLHSILDWSKTKIILFGFKSYMTEKSNWNYLWTLFVSACLFYAAMPKLRRNNCGTSAQLAWLILFGYFVVLHTSPHEIVWQIQTALQRLLLHAGGLALVFTFEVYGQMVMPASKVDSCPQLK